MITKNRIFENIIFTDFWKFFFLEVFLIKKEEKEEERKNFQKIFFFIKKILRLRRIAFENIIFMDY